MADVSDKKRATPPQKLVMSPNEVAIVERMKARLGLRWVVFDQRKRELIQARADEGVPYEMMLEAIDGAATDDFVRKGGFTKGGVRANSIEHLFRDVETLEKYANTGHQQKRAKVLSFEDIQRIKAEEMGE